MHGTKTGPTEGLTAPDITNGQTNQSGRLGELISSLRDIGRGQDKPAEIVPQEDSSTRLSYMRTQHFEYLRGGGKWWLALGAGVVAIDILSRETLSNSAARLRESENPMLKGAFYAGLGYLALHLCDGIPRNMDPLDRGIDEVRNFLAGSDGK